MSSNKGSALDVEFGSSPPHTDDVPTKHEDKASIPVPYLQKLIAEVFGTYFLIFVGCGAIMVNLIKGSVTFPGICVVWGLAVMVLVYTVGHISGGHFNPAVTIAFASCGRFPWREVPGYILCQLLASTVATGTLYLIFGGKQELFPGTVPAGSNLQSLVMELIISFYLMFVISGVATDSRAIGEFSGLAIGSTIMINAFVAGPISGASMNPVRSLGPAIVSSHYQSIWVYIIGPTFGTILGAWAYNLIRSTDKPLNKIVNKERVKEFLGSICKNG